MQAADTESTSTQSKIVSRHQHRGATYNKVVDKRKRPIRGLWERNGRYYAQLTVEDQVTGFKQVKRVPMEGVSTDAQAVAKLHELLTQRRKGAKARCPSSSGHRCSLIMRSSILIITKRLKTPSGPEPFTPKKSSSSTGLNTSAMSGWIASHGRWSTASSPSARLTGVRAGR